MPEEKTSTNEPTQPTKDPKSFTGHAAPPKKSKRTAGTRQPKTGSHDKQK